MVSDSANFARASATRLESMSALPSEAIVQATRFYDDPKKIAEVSKGLGSPMRGIALVGGTRLRRVASARDPGQLDRVEGRQGAEHDAAPEMDLVVATKDQRDDRRDEQPDTAARQVNYRPVLAPPTAVGYLPAWRPNGVRRPS